MRRVALLLVLVLATTAISGCKLRLRIAGGGTVESSSTTNDCGANSVCTIEVVDLFFDDTFTAKPRDGFIFGGWKRGDQHLCGGRRDPCRLFTSEFEGVPQLEQILASNRVFFLDPDFINLANVLPGTWEGEWNNLTFGSSGAITITLTARNNGTIDYVFDIDGNVFGQADPPPVSGNLPVTGATSSDEMVEFNGQMVRVISSLSENGLIEVRIPNLGIPGLDSFEATGTFGRRLIDMEYAVNFTTGAPAVGTIEVRKQ